MKDKYLQELVEKLTLIDDQKTMSFFLDDLLTEKELREMSSRLQILKRLLNKMSQREVAAELKVGIATVTKGAVVLKKERNKSWWTSWLWC